MDMMWCVRTLKCELISDESWWRKKPTTTTCELCVCVCLCVMRLKCVLSPGCWLHLDKNTNANEKASVYKCKRPTIVSWNALWIEQIMHQIEYHLSEIKDRCTHQSNKQTAYAFQHDPKSINDIIDKTYVFFFGLDILNFSLYYFAYLTNLTENRNKTKQQINTIFSAFLYFCILSTNIANSVIHIISNAVNRYISRIFVRDTISNFNCTFHFILFFAFL